MNLPRLLVVASVVCFAVALLSACGVVHTDETAWAVGGALAFVGSFAL